MMRRGGGDIIDADAMWWHEAGDGGGKALYYTMGRGSSEIIDPHAMW